MSVFKRRKGLGEQLSEILVSALTQPGNGSTAPAAKGRRRSGLRSVAAGAALYTTGRELARRRSSNGSEPEEPEAEEERVRRRVRVGRLADD